MVSEPQVVMHHAVVTLNNQGVLLIQRGAYEDAMATFKDGLQVIKDSISETIEGHHDLNVAIDRSSQRLIRSMKKCSQTENASRFVFVTTQHNAALVLEQSSLDSDKIVLVHIEHQDLQPWDNQNNLELQSSILLYNYGVANLCASNYQTSRSWQSKQYFLQEAFRFFRLAEALHRQCTSRFESYTKEGQNNNSWLEDKNLLLLLVIPLTQILTRLCVQLKHTDSTYYEELHEMIVEEIPALLRCSLNAAPVA